MNATLDRPPTISPPKPPAPPEEASPQPPVPNRPQRSLWQHYQQHAWIGGIALIAITSAVVPMMLRPQAPASAGRS
jgi:hypothetical protein